VREDVLHGKPLDRNPRHASMPAAKSALFNYRLDIEYS
jgi:hypothetical protein